MKFNDWGPYDYHRDFNLTFPFQGIIDLSTTLNKPKFLDFVTTRVGIRGTYRTLNQYSPRYTSGNIPDGAGNFEPGTDIIGAGYGNEWEIRTYITFSLF